MARLLEHKGKKNKRILERLSDKKVVSGIKAKFPKMNVNQIHAAIYLDDFWGWAG